MHGGLPTRLPSGRCLSPGRALFPCTRHHSKCKFCARPSPPRDALLLRASRVRLPDARGRQVSACAFFATRTSRTSCEAGLQSCVRLGRLVAAPGRPASRAVVLLPTATFPALRLETVPPAIARRSSRSVESSWLALLRRGLGRITRLLTRLASGMRLAVMSWPLPTSSRGRLPLPDLLMAREARPPRSACSAIAAPLFAKSRENRRCASSCARFTLRFDRPRLRTADHLAA